jgi:hypothetical protein
MRLAQPLAELIPIAHSWRIPACAHPCPKIICAYPAWVDFAEEIHELSCLGLLGGVGSLRVVGGESVKECPRGAAELLDIWRTVGSANGCRLL